MRKELNDHMNNVLSTDKGKEIMEKFMREVTSLLPKKPIAVDVENDTSGPRG